MRVIKRFAVPGAIIVALLTIFIFIYSCMHDVPYRLLESREITIHDLPEGLKGVLLVAQLAGSIPKEIKALQLTIGVDRREALNDALVVKAIGEHIGDRDEMVKAGVVYFKKIDGDVIEDGPTLLFMRSRFCEGCEHGLELIARRVGETKRWIIFMPVGEKY